MLDSVSKEVVSSKSTTSESGISSQSRISIGSGCACGCNCGVGGAEGTGVATGLGSPEIGSSGGVLEEVEDAAGVEGGRRDWRGRRRAGCSGSLSVSVSSRGHPKGLKKVLNGNGTTSSSGFSHGIVTPVFVVSGSSGSGS